MRRYPERLSFEDIGRAARALARLPDTGAQADGNALAALAWASVNFWSTVHEGGGGPFPLSMTAEGLIGFGGGVALIARPRNEQIWRSLAHLAMALANDGGDPSFGATHFHHGRAAPDWALAKEPSRWIGRWAFYGGVEVTPKLEARGVAPAGFPP